MHPLGVKSSNFFWESMPPDPPRWLMVLFPKAWVPSLLIGILHPWKNLYKSVKLKTVVMDQQVASVKGEVAHLQSEMITKIQPLVDAVVRIETTVQQLQGFGEMALMVQTLQAASYSGTFIWKIPKVQRRRGEVRLGRTVSLHSICSILHWSPWIQDVPGAVHGWRWKWKGH